MASFSLTFDLINLTNASKSISWTNSFFLIGLTHHLHVGAFFTAEPGYGQIDLTKFRTYLIKAESLENVYIFAGII